MRYRDHVNTAGLLFVGARFLYETSGQPGMDILFPFLRALCVFPSDTVISVMLAAAFFGGAVFPDADIRLYGNGHRASSPMHNLSVALCLYGASLLLCALLWERTRHPSYWASLICSVFSFG